MFLSVIAFMTFLVNLGFSWLLGSWIGLGIYLTLLPLSILVTIGGAVALGLVGMIFGKHDDRTPGQKFLWNFLRGWAWLVCVVWLIPLAGLCIIQFTNNTAPATLPKITISNGEKRVIFQSMIHIGSPSFYDEIERDMNNLRGQDYVFFYEGVESGTPESIAELSRLMGMNMSEKMYTLFATMSGLTLQDIERYRDIIPSTNVDLSTDEIVALAREANIQNPVALDNPLIGKIGEKYTNLNSFQKNIIQIVSRGFLNILLRTYSNPSFEKNIQEQVPVYDIILGKRNALIAEAIIESPVPNIYIHYGALHYAGILAMLREKDPKWREISRTEYQVIQ